MIRVVALLLAVSFPASATPPIESLYGAYEIIGRSPGKAGSTYRGWARLAVEGDAIEIDRCVGGVHTTGSGGLVTSGADNMSAVELTFTHEREPYQATCIHTSDFDNLPRFTCYTYPTRRPNVEVPGLEAYYPIVWPVALDYYDCR